MIVVADTSPPLYLSRIGRLGLLRKLYGEVIVPETVWQELVSRRPDAPGVDALRASTWLRRSEAAEMAGIEPSLVEALDPGEAAAITLVTVLDADLLLIDERKGRRVALRRGLRIRETLGVLVEARRADLVTSLAHEVRELTKIGFRIADPLIERALEAVGER